MCQLPRVEEDMGSTVSRSVHAEAEELGFVFANFRKPAARAEFKSNSRSINKIHMVLGENTSFCYDCHWSVPTGCWDRFPIIDPTVNCLGVRLGLSVGVQAPAAVNTAMEKPKDARGAPPLLSSGVKDGAGSPVARSFSFPNGL